MNQHPEFEKIDISRLARAAGEVVGAIKASDSNHVTEVLLSLENAMHDIWLVMHDYVVLLEARGIVVAPRWRSINDLLSTSLWEIPLPSKEKADA